MTKTKCLRCGEDFSPSRFKRHITRKRALCEPIMSNCSYEDMKTDYEGTLVIITGKYACKDCGNRYKHSSSLARHRKECGARELMILRQRIQNLESQPQVAAAPHTINNDHSSGDRINITSNDNSNHTNNFNVNIDPFGKEDISHITHAQFDKVIKLRYAGIKEFARILYYENPKNFNVYLPNKSRKRGLVFNPPNWENKNSDEISEIVVQNTADQISDYMENNPERVSRADYRAMDRALTDVQKNVRENYKQRGEVLDLLYENSFRNDVWENFKAESGGEKIIEPLITD